MLSFIVVFGVTKALDELPRRAALRSLRPQAVLVAGWLVARPCRSC